MTIGRLAQSRVGVLGTGEVGQRLAAGFAGRGHSVMIGTRDPGKPELREWLAADGAGIEAGTFAETAAYGQLLVLAVLGTAAEETIGEAGPSSFSGKVVIDATNPLDFSGGFPPKLVISGEDSLGERLQRALPEAKVVKAFNTIGNPYFVDPSFPDGKPTMLIAVEVPEKIPVPPAIARRSTEFERVTVDVPSMSKPSLLSMPRIRSNTPLPAFMMTAALFSSNEVLVTESGLRVMLLSMAVWAC